MQIQGDLACRRVRERILRPFLWRWNCYNFPAAFYLLKGITQGTKDSRNNFMPCRVHFFLLTLNKMFSFLCVIGRKYKFFLFWLHIHLQGLRTWNAINSSIRFYFDSSCQLSNKEIFQLTEYHSSYKTFSSFSIIFFILSIHRYAIRSSRAELSLLGRWNGRRCFLHNHAFASWVIRGAVKLWGRFVNKKMLNHEKILSERKEI